MAIKGMKPLGLTAYIVGAVAMINWGLKPLGINLVEKVMGLVNLTSYVNWVYYAIGALGIYAAYKLFK